MPFSFLILPFTRDCDIQDVKSNLHQNLDFIGTDLVKDEVSKNSPIVFSFFKFDWI